VGPRAVLDAVVKRKIPSPSRESKPRTPIVQPVVPHGSRQRKKFFTTLSNQEQKWQILSPIILLTGELEQLSGIALGYWLDDLWFESRLGLEIFPFTTSLDRLCGPPSLVSNAYQALFPWG
jgi:hypothetical protein